jgi:hypothetical protein
MDRQGWPKQYLLVGFKLPLEKVSSNNIIDIYPLSVKDKMNNTLNNSNLYANETNNEKGKHDWALGAIKMVRRFSMIMNCWIFSRQQTIELRVTLEFTPII